MKKVLLAVTLAVAGCATDRLVTFDPTPIVHVDDVADIRKAIIASALQRDWKVDEVADDFILATYDRGSSWSVTVKIAYDSDSYHLTYYDSQNFRYNPDKQRIHNHYTRWATILKRTIDSKLYN